MGGAFSRGHLTETMEQYEGDGVTTSVAVDEVAEHEAPSGMALHRFFNGTLFHIGKSAIREWHALPHRQNRLVRSKRVL